MRGDGPRVPERGTGRGGTGRGRRRRRARARFARAFGRALASLGARSLRSRLRARARFARAFGSAASDDAGRPVSRLPPPVRRAERAEPLRGPCPVSPVPMSRTVPVPVPVPVPDKKSALLLVAVHEPAALLAAELRLADLEAARRVVHDAVALDAARGLGAMEVLRLAADDETVLGLGAVEAAFDLATGITRDVAGPTAAAAIVAAGSEDEDEPDETETSCADRHASGLTLTAASSKARSNTATSNGVVATFSGVSAPSAPACATRELLGALDGLRFERYQPAPQLVGDGGF